ncbi:hypothetical protein ACIQWR_17060 [Streptomyces sp. NPDC098789]|uniref:hypothetical protein n=1 Tax=Streptomyces sp. NPDC098789 TaxID=3366098 RepID=UPI0038115305
MLVGVCDFPGSYAFPPAGYGGIERWLWAVAVGADVHLLGQGWLPDLEHDWVRKPVRLEDITVGSLAERELRDTGYDLLVVGHEYPSLPAWTRTWNELDCDVATFQHSPVFQHTATATAFDGERSRLYCYSPEMIERYANTSRSPSSPSTSASTRKSRRRSPELISCGSAGSTRRRLASWAFRGRQSPVSSRRRRSGETAAMRALAMKSTCEAG